MLRSLPPFSGLTAFYAAVRFGTLTGAAHALNVSQPAITRRIARLEADLGCALFDRSRKPAILTEEGRELMDVLRSSFDGIGATADRIRLRGTNQVVTVTGPSGFVSFWLIPRLGDLQSALPDTTIRVISSEHDMRDTSGDIRVRFGIAGGAEETKILGEAVFAAASPIYLSRHAAPADAGGFAGLTLLSMERTRSQWYDWHSWFAATAGRSPPIGRYLHFNSYAMLISAALAGQGVCLCWSGLVDSYLASGALVRLTDLSASSERGYFLSVPRGPAAAAGVAGVADWIRRQTESGHAPA